MSRTLSFLSKMKKLHMENVLLLIESRDNFQNSCVLLHQYSTYSSVSETLESFCCGLCSTLNRENEHCVTPEGHIRRLKRLLSAVSPL